MILNNNRKILKLFLKLALLSTPLVFLSVFYFITDPFKVINKNIKYENYYDHQPYELNREFVSTELLIKNYPKYHYNSFILGSCESYVYRTDIWKKYISVDKEKIFHYPAASETLYGIYLKIKYLDKQNIPIKNCLLVMDISTFKDIEQKHDYIHSNHPALSGESSISFQLNMFKSYFSNFFCIQYLDYKLTGKVKGYMKGNLGVTKGQIRTTILNNEYYYEKYDVAIKKDSVAFYKKNKNAFYSRNKTNKQILLQAIFKKKHIDMLTEINSIFVKHNTNFKIILSPMYDQVYFNPTDIKELSRIFGEQNLHDYSGINRFTENISYFYDNFHYKANAANEIMHEIYNSNKKL